MIVFLKGFKLSFTDKIDFFNINSKDKNLIKIILTLQTVRKVRKGNNSIGIFPFVLQHLGKKTQTFVSFGNLVSCEEAACLKSTNRFFPLGLRLVSRFYFDWERDHSQPKAQAN